VSARIGGFRPQRVERDQRTVSELAERKLAPRSRRGFGSERTIRRTLEQEEESWAPRNGRLRAYHADSLHAWGDTRAPVVAAAHQAAAQLPRGRRQRSGALNNCWTRRESVVNPVGEFPARASFDGEQRVTDGAALLRCFRGVHRVIVSLRRPPPDLIKRQVLFQLSQRLVGTDVAFALLSTASRSVCLWPPEVFRISRQWSRSHHAVEQVRSYHLLAAWWLASGGRSRRLCFRLRRWSVSGQYGHILAWVWA
jgi:hypothetical protein